MPGNLYFRHPSQVPKNKILCSRGTELFELMWSLPLALLLKVYCSAVLRVEEIGLQVSFLIAMKFEKYFYKILDAFQKIIWPIMNIHFLSLCISSLPLGVTSSCYQWHLALPMAFLTWGLNWCTKCMPYFQKSHYIFQFSRKYAFKK